MIIIGLVYLFQELSSQLSSLSDRLSDCSNKMNTTLSEDLVLLRNARRMIDSVLDNVESRGTLMVSLV